MNAFALKGDSGSVILNNDNEVVGLLFACKSTYAINIFIDDEAVTENTTTPVEIPTGQGIAAHIGPVLQEMDIRIESGTTPTSGRAILTPGIFLKSDINAEELSLKEALDALEKEMLASSNGKRFIQIIKNFLPELIQLINHRRPVKLIWNKYQGPAFTTVFMNGVRNRKSLFRKEVNEISIRTLMLKMYDVLMQEGSPELRSTIEQYNRLLYELAEYNSIEEIINYITHSSLTV
jgi:hypothetical protein